MGLKAALSLGWEKHMSSSKTIVTIKGSTTPCVKLPRGETQTVVLTPDVQRLIDKGFVTVTERHVIAPPKRPAFKSPSSNG